MVILSTSLGWIYNEFDLFSSEWSGSSGVALAQILYNMTGIGSAVILSVLLLITFLILLDRDLQKTVDAFKGGMARWKEKRAEKKELKERKKQEKKYQKEKKKAEKLAKKEHEKNIREKEEKKTLSIDEIVEKSHRQDLERKNREHEEIEGHNQKPRAVLEKGGSSDRSNEDDVDITVIVGEGDEEAEDKALDRQNKDKAKEIPVIKYKFPTIDLLDAPPLEGNEVDLEEIKENKRIILDKLKRHKIEILSINAIVGPTVTLYELEPAPDVKISKIQSYANDLKMATAAHGLRIIAPIPGRSAVGIEVPNSSREIVYIRSVINTKKFVNTEYELPVAFGKTIENEVFMIDLTRMPHLLMGRATGSGKSVGINTIITCLLYKCHPDDLKFVMIDPKKIELSLYRNIQNHFLAYLPGSEEPIVTDTSKALETLQSVCKEMDERYELLKWLWFAISRPIMKSTIPVNLMMNLATGIYPISS
jgi:DNA segregation ATPase FtsK/SpoIIIE, S-DNA-T family